MPSKFNQIFTQKNWTLFLDRDGVINQLQSKQPVTNIQEFHFVIGARESLKIFSAIFNRIIIVTNQYSVGNGLLTEIDLERIHAMMLSGIESASGRVDKIYYCPLAGNLKSFYRKPQVGMAIRAKKDFPEIKFRRSVIVGDSVSDMLFGKKLNMTTVLINGNRQLITKNYRIIDYNFDSIYEFANHLNDSATG